MPDQLDAYLEVAGDGNWTAHVLALPGCVAFGRSQEEALAGLRQDVDAYRAWLRRHGEPDTSVDGGVGLRVVQVVRAVSPARASGEKVACFGPDRVPVTAADIERAIRLMRYARADLLALLDALGPDGLARQPAGSDRTLRRIAQHIGQAECWYLTRLEEGDDPEVGALYDRLDADLIGTLAGIQALAERTFRGWTPEQRRAVYTPGHFSRYGDEAWTARKVLRRFIEHQREHLAEMQGYGGEE